MEYFESPTFCATKIYKRGPGGPNTQAMADIQTWMQVRYLPNCCLGCLPNSSSSRGSQDLCVVGSTGYKVPDLIGDWTHLLLEHPEHLERSAGVEEKFKVGRAASSWPA